MRPRRFHSSPDGQTRSGTPRRELTAAQRQFKNHVTIENATWEDRFVRSFPADPSHSKLPRQVRGALYSLIEPTPVENPRIIAWSDDAARLLGLERPPAQGVAAEVLGGSCVLPGMKPFATCYGGHQFGHWAGQLGDGRALILGELNGWEIQLKGAGPTPYSRRADGRAVLRSSVREFLCSEIMHYLGVPTTRALSLVATGDSVVRDMFYDGHPEAEPGAICTRISPTFIRFGHFEIFAHRGEKQLLEQLLDFVMREYYPECKDRAHWFHEVCRRTALLMVDWMRVGFVHGVMNTDNMSILGLTIDYGPYGWLDPYDPGFTPNTTDVSGRYAFGQQGMVALWNLDCLAGALSLLFQGTAELEAGLELYGKTFNKAYRDMLLGKIGLAGVDDSSHEELLRELLQLLVTAETDMTIFFRRLAEVDVSLENPPLDPLLEAYYNEVPHEALQAWLRKYAPLAQKAGPDRKDRMNRVNPRIVPRNYLVQEVIDRAAGGETGGIEEMLNAFKQPYRDAPPDKWEKKRPDWARNAPGCSALSCSS